MTAPLVCVLLSALSAPALSVDCTHQYSAPDAVLPFSTELAARRTEPPPTQPAKGRFLVAKRSVSDPRFAETVILLLAYSERGAMGIIINRPTEVPLATALPKMKELKKRSDRVFVGGPVSPAAMLLLIRSVTQPDDARPVFADIYVSGSLETLRQSMAKASKAQRVRAYAGYAGWGPSQLDHEIARGDWAIGPADADSIFETAPADVWPKLIDRFSLQWARNDDVTPMAVPVGDLRFAVSQDASF